MKLLTHNFLSSHFLRGAVTGYPLALKVEKVEKVPDVEFSHEFTCRMIPKLEYAVLVAASSALKAHFPSDEELMIPGELPENYKNDEEFLKKVHAALVGYEVVEGELQCPDTQRIFPIRDGIPNMLANADEV